MNAINVSYREKIKDKLRSALVGNIEYELREYPDENFTEIDFDYEKTASNLMEAGIGDVSEALLCIDVLAGVNAALNADINGTEEDRLHWIQKYRDAERRIEVLELALDNLAEHAFETSEEAEIMKREFITQAEKEIKGTAEQSQ